MQLEARRRLTDLYSRGRNFQIEDREEGIYEEVYLRKMTPLEMDQAFARATTARARAIAATKDGSDDAYAALKANVDEMTHDDLVNWVVGSETTQKRSVYEAQEAAEDEWGKNKYLEGLQDFFVSETFQDMKADDPDNPEVVRVENEIKRFDAAVDKRIADERETLQELWSASPDDEMRKRVLNEISDMKGNSEWLIEYKKSQIWLCTYETENHRTRYFQKRDEVDQLQKPVTEQLLAAIEKLHVSDAEGKD